MFGSIARRVALAWLSVWMAGAVAAAGAAAAGSAEPPASPLLRVGLATDLELVQLPCCDARRTAIAGGSRLVLDRETRVEPAPGTTGHAVYRLQVAALKDEAQAERMAETLGRAAGLESDVTFDADTDLYKVRLGRFPDRAAVDRASARLTAAGSAPGFVVTEGGALLAPAFQIRRGAEVLRLEGRWLDIEAPDDLGTPWNGTRYRGRLALFLNERGRLNVINELPLESYLRGVVPKEMGPDLYDQLEALKAQAVAARTYTVRNLGEFESEGYDICSTPRCQVYGGMGVEHPLSDRAIAETHGQVVLFDGRPAETFYSATSGGHTENVEVVFPEKRGAYLRGVPCFEAGPTRVGASRPAAPRGAPYPVGVAEALLPFDGDAQSAGPGRGAAELGRRFERLAALAGLAEPRDRLRSMEGREVLRFVGSLFDLALDPALLGPAAGRGPADLEPADLDPAEADLGESLSSLRGTSAPIEAAAAETLLFRLARVLGLIEEIDAHFLSFDGQTLRVRRGGQHVVVPVSADVATFRQRQGALRAAPLELVPGDALRLVRRVPADGADRGARLLALVQPVDAVSTRLDAKHAPRQVWSQFRTLGDLRRSVAARYPGFELASFELGERGVSGRVGELELRSTDGRTLEVTGLAVRWTLDLPDTLFEVESRRDARGRSGWLFQGRGWGHGVGMSQAGAFGMARRGLSYRDILEHYYTGVQLGRVRAVAPRPRPLAAAPAPSRPASAPAASEVAASIRTLP